MADELKGKDEMARKLKALADRFPDVVARAIYAEAEIEMTESKRRVPVDTGNLRATGHVTPPKRDWRNIQVRLVYGGPSAPYAVHVHEDLEAFHRVGEAKFLESVLTESAPFMAQRIGNRVAREMGMK